MALLSQNDIRSHTDNIILLVILWIPHSNRIQKRRQSTFLLVTGMETLQIILSITDISINKVQKHGVNTLVDIY